MAYINPYQQAVQGRSKQRKKKNIGANVNPNLISSPSLTGDLSGKKQVGKRVELVMFREGFDLPMILPIIWLWVRWQGAFLLAVVTVDQCCPTTTLKV